MHIPGGTVEIASQRHGLFHVAAAAPFTLQRVIADPQHTAGVKCRSLENPFSVDERAVQRLEIFDDYG
jgi:hypothetical protein